MISYIKGTVEHKYPGCTVIEAAGIGYEVLLPISTYQKLPSLGSYIKIYTYEYIREDARQLYGFFQPEDREVFEMLLSVSHIGPKVALNILSVMTADEFRVAVAQSEMGAFTKIPGVGKKTAQRLILELKEKVGEISPVHKDIFPLGGKFTKDSVAALMSLGAAQSAAEIAVYKAEQVLGEDASLEAIIKQALKLLANSE